MPDSDVRRRTAVSMIGPMFRVSFGKAAEEAITKRVPESTATRVVEMLRAIGETAAEMDSGEGPALGREKLNLSLTADSFLFHYTLDVRNGVITVFSVTPVLTATG